MKATNKRPGENLTEAQKRELAAELGLVEFESDDMQNVLAELGESGGGTVRVDRLRDGRTREFVDEFDVASFTLKLLRDVAGGGDYILQVRDADKKYRKQSRISIAANAKPVVVTPSEPSGFDKLSAELRKQNELLTMLLMKGAAPAGGSRKEVLEELQIMASIVGGKGGGLGVESILNVFKTGVEVAQQAGGDGNPWPAAVVTLADKLAEPLALLATKLATPAVRVPVHPAQPGVPALPVAKPKPQETGMLGTNLKLKMGVNFLIERAVAESPAELYADLILDNVADEILKTYLGEGVDKMVEILAGVDPRVNEHVEWFRSLGQAVAEAMADDVTDAARSAAGNGAPGETS